MPSPTPLAALLLALGLLPPLLLGPGALRAVVLWDALVALAFALDAALSPRPRAVRASRRFRDPLSAFAPNRITLRLEGAAPRALRLALADAPPPTFDARGHRRTLLLPAAGALTLTYEAIPLERGSAQFGDLHLRAGGPLGLAQRQWRVPLRQDARVYPDLRSLALFASPSEPEGARRHPAALREGREFESLRPYLPDDDVRAIDWKATARRGAPIVRQWQPERNQTVWLVVDCGRLLSTRLPDGRTKLDRAVDAALAVARAATGRGDRVGALLFGAEVHRIVPPGSGRSQLGPVAEALHAAAASGEESDYRAALDALEARQRRRALVVVFTDLADPDTSALLISRASHLRRRHLVLVATASDSEVADAARGRVRTPDDAYVRAAAARILAERSAAAARLAAAGVLVESCAAARLAAGTVGRYLGVKARGEL